MQTKNKLGLLSLCGLIIGPILGSGIVLLPPIAYKIVGKWAIISWIIIMLLGIVFAYVFTYLSLKSPGNEGVAIAVGKTLGMFWRELSENFLTTAACFGPVAVIVTASGFLKKFPILSDLKVELIAFFLILLCLIILILGVKTLGVLTLVLTGFTAILLFFGSLYTLIFYSYIRLPEKSFPLNDFGYTLLLLFWAIVGWEVLGSYIEDIHNPKKTLMRAMVISVSAITIIYLMVSFAVQSTITREPSVAAIMFPLFGSFTVPIMGIIASGLCISTYLMIVGAVTKMSAARSIKKRLPLYLSHLNKMGSPYNAICTIGLIHFFMLILLALNVLSVDSLVGCANVFFISNAIIGLISGFRLLENIKLRILISMLIFCFILLLFNANIWSLILFSFIIFISGYRYKSIIDL